MNNISMRFGPYSVYGAAIPDDGRFLAGMCVTELRDGVWHPLVERLLETSFATEVEALAAIAVIASSTYG